MRSKFLITRFFLFLVICLSFNALNAQPLSEEIKSVVQQDSLFWTAFNNCDIGSMMQFITDDIEFFHDKNGVLSGKENFKKAFQKNLCSNKDFRLRRESVKPSIKVFSMKSGDTLYGAVTSGEHLFYVSETGKGERLDGIGKFMNLWLLQDGAWKMARVLSYDHGPAPYVSSRKAIYLAAAVLNKYAGKYNSKKNGLITIKPQDTTLALLVGNQKFILYPEASNLFFTKERDLRFEFVSGEKRIAKMIVYENGVVAEENEIVK